LQALAPLAFVHWLFGAAAAAIAGIRLAGCRFGAPARRASLGFSGGKGKAGGRRKIRHKKTEGKKRSLRCLAPALLRMLRQKMAKASVPQQQAGGKPQELP
jgi:hypothetical protein